MQLIRLPKTIHTAERVLPELVADWMNSKSVQNINNSFIKKLKVNRLMSCNIQQSKGWMPHRRTFRNFTHLVLAIWDLSNHILFWIIPNPVSQKRMTLSLESFNTIPFQAGASYVNIPEWRQHSSNRAMPWLISTFGTFRGTQVKPNKNPGIIFRRAVDIISSTTNCEILLPNMLVAWAIGVLCHVGCTDCLPNCRTGRKLILRIPPPVTRIHLAVYWATCQVCEVHQFKIEVCLKWEMCQKELYSFQYIPVV